MSRRSKYDSSGGALASSAQAQDISPGPDPGGGIERNPDIEFAGVMPPRRGGAGKHPNLPVVQNNPFNFKVQPPQLQGPFANSLLAQGLAKITGVVPGGIRQKAADKAITYFYNLENLDREKYPRTKPGYDKYMKERMAGTIDAYGNPIGGNPLVGGLRDDPNYIYLDEDMEIDTPEGIIDDEEVVEEGGGGGGVADTVYPYEFYGQPDYETSSTFESYLARGGRVPAAFGGIMDTNTGRKAYGLGSIFKGVKKAIGKVLGSPVGMGIAALTMGGGLGGLGRGLLGVKGIGGPAHGAKLGLLGKLGLTQGYGSFLPTWTGGILGLSSLPFFGIGTQAKQDTLPGGGGGGRLINPLTGKEDSPAGIRTSLNEAIVEAGDDPDKIAEIKEAFPFVNLSPAPFDKYADGGRIGFAAGGMDFYTDEEGNYREGAFKEKAKEIGGSYDKGLLDFGAGENMVFDLMHKKYELGLSMEEAIAELEKEWEESIVEGGYKPGQTNIGNMGIKSKDQIREKVMEGWDMVKGPTVGTGIMTAAYGGRVPAQEGGLMDLGGMEKDYRNNGGFVAIGGEERADDVPARLSRNEFVFTADAVRGAGGGDIDKGAEIMENVMKNLEQGGKMSEESQGNAGAQEMFSVSERIGEVL